MGEGAPGRRRDAGGYIIPLGIYLDSASPAEVKSQEENSSNETLPRGNG